MRLSRPCARSPDRREMKFINSSVELHREAILLREMPNIKYTKRKEAAFACNECESTFRQRTNYLRHLGIIHEKDEAGEPISDEALDRMKSYNAKKKTQGPPAKKPKKSVAIVKPSSSSSSRPASHPASPPSAALGRPPSPAPGPSTNPSSPLSATQRQQLQEDLMISSDSADEYFVFVEPTDEQKDENRRGLVCRPSGLFVKPFQHRSRCRRPLRPSISERDARPSPPISWRNRPNATASPPKNWHTKSAPICQWSLPNDEDATMSFVA